MVARSLPATYWPATRNILAGLSPSLLAYTLVRIILGHEAGFGDVYAYHEAWPDLYDGTVGGAHAYLYSPAFAQAIWPFTLLPFWSFYGLLLALDIAALVYLVGWRWAGWVALLYPVYLEMAVGNIHLLLAAAIALGWWPLVLLTKVTPGVGMLYDWRHPRRLVIPLAVTAAIVAVSALLAPNLWAEWFALLASSSGTVDPWAFIDVPLLPRLILSVPLIVVAGWYGWRWMVPVVALLAMPVIWVGSVVVLLAIPRLTRIR